MKNHYTKMRPLPTWLIQATFVGLMTSQSIRLTLSAMAVCASLMGGVAEAEVIRVSAAQRSQLGIRTQAITESVTMTRQRFSAEVMVPPAQTRLVTSAQAGLVDAVYVSAGDKVKKGQKLAHVLSPSMLVQQRDYLQAKTRAQLAEATLARDEALAKDGIIPERRYRETKAQFEEAQAQLAQQTQALRLSGLSAQGVQQLSNANGMQKGLTLVAPFSGVVMEQLAVVGQRVDEMTPLFHLANLDQMWVEVYVPMTMAGQVVVGSAVEVPDLAGKNITGRVVSVVPQLNKANQVLQVRASFLASTVSLYPGQRLEVWLGLSAASASSHTQWRVPSAAIVRNGAQAMVYREVAQGVEPVAVKVTATEGQESVVDGPLSNRDRVVTQGIAALKGMVLGMGGE